MKFDIKKFSPVDIEGNEIFSTKEAKDKLYKDIANVIYEQAATIELADISKAIHAQKEVEVSTEQVNALKPLLEKGLIPMVSRQLIEHLKSL